MTSVKKVVTVFGATGKQGGSILHHLLENGNYTVRGVTGIQGKEKTKSLEQKGVQMFFANVGTGEGIDEALSGSDIVYLVTQSFNEDVTGKEYQCGQMLVDKAKLHSVKTVVWSTLVNVHSISKGSYSVAHFTEKARVEEYIRSISSAFESVIFISPSFYYQNFQSPTYAPQKNEKGEFVFIFPRIRNLICCDIRDIGKIFVRVIGGECNKFHLKTILMDAESGPIESFVETFSRVTGQKAILQKVSAEEFEWKTKIPRPDQFAEMFAFIDKYGFYGGTEVPVVEGEGSLVHGKDLVPMTTWEEYLKETKWTGECVA